MIEDHIQNLLLINAPLSALVAVNADGTKSIDWGSRTQGDVLPACFHTCDREHRATIGGTGATLEAEYSVYGVADDAALALQIANAAADAIIVAEGSSPSWVDGASTKQCAFGGVVVDAREMDVPLAVNGQDRDPCAARLILRIHFREIS